MVWLYLAFVFLGIKWGIQGIRRREDWWASFCLTSAAINLAAIITHGH